MTYSLYKNKKSIKGVSLVEVIVVLAIISLTIVSAMNVVIRANAIIKDNEIQDTANDIFLQAFELLRSPEPVKVLQGGYAELSQAATTTVYTIEFEDSIARKGYLKKAADQSNRTCSIQNELNVESIGGVTRSYPICLRISITPINGGSGTISTYLIAIELSYITTAGTVTENYQVTRYEKFAEII